MRLRLQDLHRYWGELTPIQSQFDAAVRAHPRVLLNCGRQVGKTEYLARLVVSHVLMGKRCWWLAPTHQLCRVGFSRCVLLMRRLPVYGRARYKRSAPYRVSFGEGYCDFLTTRTPDSLQGETLDLVVIDEAATVRDLSQVVEQYVEPTLAVRRGKLVMASTPKGRNDFAAYCRSPYWVSVHAPTSANPLISTEWLERQRAKYEAEGRLYYWRQEYEAEILERVGLYFERLPEVVDELPEHSEYDGCGIDWGYSSPFAAVYVLVRDGVVYVGREVYAARLTADEQARRVLAHRALVYVCDPSTPVHVLEGWRNAGLVPHPGVGDRVGGWDLVRQLIGEGRLRVHRGCFHLLDEFQQAEMDERRPDDLCGEDHALDALRYVILHAHNVAYRQSRLQAYRASLVEALSGDRVMIALSERAREQYIRQARARKKR